MKFNEQGQRNGTSIASLKIKMVHLTMIVSYQRDNESDQRIRMDPGSKVRAWDE